MRLTVSHRRVPALIGAAALVVAALAGCTASPFGGCEPALKSGDSSSTVTATGTFGAEPDVKFPTPLISKTPEVSRLIAGDGAQIGTAGQVDYAVTYFDASTGKQQAAIGYGTLSSDDPPARSAVGLKGYAISEALSCAAVGDRLVLTSTDSAAFGTEAKDGEPTYVFVIDVLARYLAKADGFNLLPQDGMPVVVTAVDGTPAITTSTVLKPDVTRVETVKGGSGATVRADDRVVVHLRAWSWPDKETEQPAEFASTWAKAQQAFTMVIDGTADNPVPPGVQNAVKGAKVGSQLLVVIPPGKDGYATPPQGITADTTLIWVVDVLGIQKESDK